MSATQLIDPTTGKIFQNLTYNGNDGGLGDVLAVSPNGGGLNMTNLGTISANGSINAIGATFGGAVNVTVGGARIAGQGLAVGGAPLGIPPLGGIATSAGVNVGNGLVVAGGGMEVQDPTHGNGVALGCDQTGNLVMNNTAGPVANTITLTASTGAITGSSLTLAANATPLTFSNGAIYSAGGPGAPGAYAPTGKMIIVIDGTQYYLPLTAV